MAYNRLSAYKTTISGDALADVIVTYHSTQIVRVERNRIILDDGGWRSVTTKRKMNQASHQFGLGFGVYQRDFRWYVSTPDGQEIEWTDGKLVLPRS